MSTERSADARVVTRAVGTGPLVLARVTDRVRDLQAIDHGGVLVPRGVGVAEGDQVVVTAPWIDGVDLAELESRRGPLSAGECVWLGTRIAAALEALHQQGIAHGDIAPANVVIAGGEVVLVDTVGGCLPDEFGTVGFRAPERAGGATAAGDAYSLGALLRWCVAAADSVPIEAWTAPLVVEDPGARPPVDVAARALASCASPQPVSVPPRSEVVAAVRARASGRTERIASGRPWRLRRLALRSLAGLVIAVAALGAVVAVPRAVDAAISSPERGAPLQSAADVSSDPPSATATPLDEGVAPSAYERPADAAVALTQQRIAALAAGDGERLLAVVGDGPLTSETEVLAERLESGEVVYENLDVEVLGVEDTERSGNSATVTLHYALTDHRIVTSEGAADVPGYEQRVELGLTWDGRWTVERVQPLT